MGRYRAGRRHHCTCFHTVPVGKPKTFSAHIRIPTYRRRTEIYTHKPEGAIEEQHYIVAPAMQGLIEEARPCTLVSVVYRDGSPRLWPIKFPRDGEKDNDAWTTARVGRQAGIGQWMRMVWVGRAYQTREALPGYAPDPDLKKLPPFNELVKLGFGEHGIIRDKSASDLSRTVRRRPNHAGGRFDGARPLRLARLPFAEIWVVDIEFYPGQGLAQWRQGRRPGHAALPRRLEMRSGRIVRIWQDEFGPFPPYRLDASALFVALHAHRRVRRSHRASGANRLRASMLMSSFGTTPTTAASRAAIARKGFYGLGGALRYFGENGIDTAHKTDMRDRIMQGPPFSADERERSWTIAKTTSERWRVLVEHIVPTIRSLPHAMARAISVGHRAARAARHSARSADARANCGRGGAESGRSRTASEIISASTRSRTASRIGASSVLPTSCGGTDGPGRRMLTGRSTKPIRLSATWQAAIRRSSRCASCAIRSRSCGSTICSRQRRPQPHAAVGLRHQDRAQRPSDAQVHLRSGEVGAVPDHAAARPCAGPPRLRATGGPQIAAVLSGDEALTARLPERRRLSRHCQAARLRAAKA